jgi:hypothetical protein
MSLRILFVAIAAAAVGVGFILPAPQVARRHARSQIDLIELRP